MSEDAALILIGYLLNWITLIPVLILCTNRNKVLALHLGIQVFYSAYFWYHYYNSSSGGGILVVWIILLFTLGIHWLSQLIQIVILLWQRRKLSDQ